jgi:hypothetical protein
MYWNKLFGNPEKLSGKFYRLLSKLFISSNRDIPWMNYIKLDLMKRVSAIYGVIKNILTLNFLMLLLSKDLKMFFLILTILQEGNIIQNSKLSSNWRIVFCDCMLFIETIFVN